MKDIGRQFFYDVVSFPKLTRGTLAVWRRNYRYFQATILVSLFWAIFEPVLYLVAVGYGLGSMVNDVHQMKYVEFFFPALLATTSMTVSFFEATYGSFTKMTHQKTFATTLLSPVGPDDVVFGEIFWATTKSLFSVVAVALVCSFFGLIHSWMIFPTVLVLFLNGWFFASLGLLTCSFARNYDSFIYAISGFIVPMSLFSGTYFPLSQMPESVQLGAYLLPLTHTVIVVRQLLVAQADHYTGMHISILFLLSVLATNWAIARVKRKLIF